MQRCRSGDNNSNLIKAHLQVPVYSSELNEARVGPASGYDRRCRTDGNATILPSTLRLLGSLQTGPLDVTEIFESLLRSIGQAN